jgi:dolichyl-phosphate-mannose--protein O-mannosyl transferase
MRILSPSKPLALVLVALVSLTVHFLDFGHPASLVFDEVHFSKFVSASTPRWESC